MFDGFLKLLTLLMVFSCQAVCASSKFSLIDRAVTKYVPSIWGNLDKGWQQVDSNVFLNMARDLELRVLTKSRLLVFNNKLSDSMLVIIFNEPKKHLDFCSIDVKAFTAPNDLNYRIYLETSYLISVNEKLLRKNCEYNLEGDYEDFIFVENLIEDEAIKTIVGNARIYRDELDKSSGNCAKIKKIIAIGHNRIRFQEKWRNAFNLLFEDINGYGGSMDVVMLNNKFIAIACSTGMKD